MNQNMKFDKFETKYLIRDRRNKIFAIILDNTGYDDCLSCPIIPDVAKHNDPLFAAQYNTFEEAEKDVIRMYEEYYLDKWDLEIIPMTMEIYLGELSEEKKIRVNQLRKKRITE